ncbi:DUF1178 family protein [Roseovarius phycicola]|uniref:DUF1178 family protein n=1 Tax=Roseovarius phycicola TaxID=3080976 RepID=A0ABZ2HPD6_9RHOB
MIKFTLKCDQDHRFESWFQSSDAFDKLERAGMVTCSICGSEAVEKAIMAPTVRASRSVAAAPTEGTKSPALTTPTTEMEQALAALKKQVEENSEYVGMNFASQARDIHDGLAPNRAIHGEAKPEEARKLIEDGVPVSPLPFIPNRKTN